MKTDVSNVGFDRFTLILVHTTLGPGQLQLPLHQLHDALSGHEEHVSLCSPGEGGRMTVDHIRNLNIQTLSHVGKQWNRSTKQ
jgi:hypothetical protein